MIRAGCVTVFVIVALRTEFVNKSKASVIKIIHRNSRQQNLTYFSRRLENSSRLLQSLHRINMKVKEYLQKVLQLTFPKILSRIYKLLETARDETSSRDVSRNGLNSVVSRNGHFSDILVVSKKSHLCNFLPVCCLDCIFRSSRICYLTDSYGSSVR